MTLEEVLRYTKAALKDACFSKTLIEEIPKFIQSQEHIIALYEHNIEYKERCIFNLQDENRMLRYERLMWKAEAIRKESSLLFMVYGDSDRSKRCARIATALEERARKIKEEM